MAKLVFMSWRRLIGCWEVKKKRFTLPGAVRGEYAFFRTGKFWRENKEYWISRRFWIRSMLFFFSFAYEDLSEAVKEYYLESNADRLMFVQKLADYFENKLQVP